jgi:hypothetical protein
VTTADAHADPALLAVDVGAVVDAHHVDEECYVVDSVDDAVGAPPRRAVSAQFSHERLADLLWLVQQRSGEEFSGGG